MPLEWAATQTNLGTALWSLGERESGTAQLEEAVAAFREALKEYTRERVPLQWAATQTNLGTALWRLGERESGTAQLEEAVSAYREALKEWTRERVPLQWAMTQNNLGVALWRLGERESGTAQARGGGRGLSRGAEGMDARAGSAPMGDDADNLGSALGARRARERDGAARGGGRRLSRGAEGTDARARAARWARRRQSRRCARTLGERESGTAQLEEAVAAYREALKEWTRERVPLDWAMTQNNLGNALCRLGERESGTAQARGGGRRLSRGAEGIDARARAARLGDDAEQSRQCALEPRRARERDGASSRRRLRPIARR